MNPAPPVTKTRIASSMLLVPRRRQAATRPRAPCSCALACGWPHDSTSASASTSSIVATGMISSSSRTCGGSRSRSRTLSLGMSTVVMPGAVRREQLLLQPADGQHAPAQRDLTGHRQIAPHRTAGEHRGERGRHGDAGARPVLGNRGRRHVDVQVVVLGEVLGDAELLRARAYVGERRGRRLAHDVAQLARHEDRRPCRASRSPR